MGRMSSSTRSPGDGILGGHPTYHRETQKDVGERQKEKVTGITKLGNKINLVTVSCKQV